MSKRALISAAVFVVALLPSLSMADGYIARPGACFPGFSSEPTVYVGYLGKADGASFTLENDATTPAVLFDFEQNYNLEGVWWELLVPFKGWGRMGFVWGFSHLFAVNAKSEEIYTPLDGGGASERTWDTDTQWWNLQMAVTYDVTSRLTTLTGLRYDSFMTKFTDPQTPATGGMGENSDGADLTVAAYIPYFGLLVHDIGLRPGLRASVGAIGWPFLWGSFDYREGMTGSGIGTADGIPVSTEFRSGYFLEGFAEASLQRGSWALGAFVKFNGLHGQAVADIGERSSRIPSDEYRVNFDRQSWAVGGKVALIF